MLDCGSVLPGGAAAVSTPSIRFFAASGSTTPPRASSASRRSSRGASRRRGVLRSAVRRSGNTSRATLAASGTRWPSDRVRAVRSRRCIRSASSRCSRPIAAPAIGHDVADDVENRRRGVSRRVVLESATARDARRRFRHLALVSLRLEQAGVLDRDACLTSDDREELDIFVAERAALSATARSARRACDRRAPWARRSRTPAAIGSVAADVARNERAPRRDRPTRDDRSGRCEAPSTRRTP